MEMFLSPRCIFSMLVCILVFAHALCQDVHFVHSPVHQVTAKRLRAHQANYVDDSKDSTNSTTELHDDDTVNADSTTHTKHGQEGATNKSNMIDILVQKTFHNAPFMKHDEKGSNHADQEKLYMQKLASLVRNQMTVSTRNYINRERFVHASKGNYINWKLQKNLKSAYVIRKLVRRWLKRNNLLKQEVKNMPIEKLKKGSLEFFAKIEGMLGENKEASKAKKARDKKHRKIFPADFRNFESQEFIYPIKGLYVAQYFRLVFVLLIFLGTLFIYSEQEIIETVITGTLSLYLPEDGWTCVRLTAVTEVTDDKGDPEIRANYTNTTFRAIMYSERAKKDYMLYQWHKAYFKDYEDCLHGYFHGSPFCTATEDDFYDTEFTYDMSFEEEFWIVPRSYLLDVVLKQPLHSWTKGTTHKDYTDEDGPDLTDPTYPPNNDVNWTTCQTFYQHVHPRVFEYGRCSSPSVKRCPGCRNEPSSPECYTDAYCLSLNYRILDFWLIIKVFILMFW